MFVWVGVVGGCLAACSGNSVVGSPAVIDDLGFDAATGDVTGIEDGAASNVPDQRAVRDIVPIDINTVRPDVGTGGYMCQACASDADCGAMAFCVRLAAGARVCLRSCNMEVPGCPPRFDCLNSLLTPTAGPVCTPVGERCCVDEDGDDHGVGVGCRGADCDDARPGVFAGAAETCNGVDDDCDGEVDDGNPGGGVLCTTGLMGACSAGATRCAGGMVSCVSTAGTVAETCDGVDNDCDGSVDEDLAGRSLTQSCYDGPAGTAGIGGCVAGVQTCAGGMFRSCVGEVRPGVETCNGLDDDCDGEPDDGDPGGGIACASASPGVCRPGTTRCREGAVVCVPNVAPNAMVERCDALDNDCDGMIDEGFAYADDPATPGVMHGLGEACGARLGACRRSGVVTCSGTGMAAVCSAPVVTGTTERCNQIDDDCNGIVDDGFGNAAGVYNTDANCGACGVDCTMIYARPNAFGTCQVTGSTATCVMNCNAGTFNLNGVPDDGCEFALDAGAVYVSSEDPAAANDASCGLGPTRTGTGNHPCVTIAFGQGRARSLGRGRVRIADALYAESVVVGNGQSLLGGHRADTWERHVSTTLTIVRGASGAGHRRAITAIGIDATTLVEGLVVNGANATTAGANSYAIYVSGGTNALTLRGNIVYAGDGAPGTPGAAGADGARGVPGTVGRAAFDTGSSACGTSSPGGAGGALNCGGADVSGGAGGSANCPMTWSSGVLVGSSRAGVAGSGPGRGAGGAAAYDGQTRSAEACLLCHLGGGGSMTGGNGVLGTSGGSGAGGPGATSGLGTVSGGDWTASGGGGGGAAVNGGGGGGGGSGGGGDGTGGASSCTDDLGATGGGGGSGGCAGAPGAGAGGGGGSFAIFLVNATTFPVLANNTIYRGFGGAGGGGGRGGVGGVAGVGAAGGLKSNANPSFCTGDGGYGGAGGNGGHGGGGGGGAGGASYGIYASGMSGYGATTNTFPASGGGGPGGDGGPSLGTSGTAGAPGGTGPTN